MRTSRYWLVLLALMAGCGGGGTTPAVYTPVPDLSMCVAPMLLCGNGCVDSSSDAKNCGACGTACDADHACTAGKCTLACHSGTTQCGGGGDGGAPFCTNLKIDVSNCGACGTACPPGNVCAMGACALTCPKGLDACGGSCVNFQADLANCGGCGMACPQGNVCSMGKCALSCQQGLDNCGGVCANLQSDPGNCGGCGMACPQGNFCVMGHCGVTCPQPETLCGDVCVDTRTDPANCGGCATQCPQANACVQGQCLLQCPKGTTTCGNTCVNTAIDPANCGACGKVCPGGQLCVMGTCSVDCPAPFAVCSGACVDPRIDPANCGGCAKVCSTANALGSTCVAGACNIIACKPNFASCDNDASNGCEANLLTDAANCGGCGKACAQGQVCSNATCMTKCSTAAMAWCAAKGGAWKVSPWATSFPNQPGGSIFCVTTSAGSDCDACGTYNQIVWKNSAKDACSSVMQLVAGNVYGGHSPCQCAANLPVCGQWPMNGCLAD